MKNNGAFKSIIVLVAICAFIAAAMAGVNMMTLDRILENKIKKEQQALDEVLKDNGGFEKLENIDDLPQSVVAIYRDLDGEGIAMVLSAKGYDASNPISIAVGFDNDGNIEKCHVISATGETKGIGSKVTDASFLAQFSGKKDTYGVDTISGATISSSAFSDAIADACEAFARIAESEVAE